MLTLVVAFAAAAQADDEDVADLLSTARPAATAPAPVTSPSAPEFRPTPAASQPAPPAPPIPARARQATLTLSTGKVLTGNVWTTADTPFRIFAADEKTYHDVDLALVARIDVKVLQEGLEDDWRWLKEGSDQKIFSGKKYPAVTLAYRFTLQNGQTVEGGVVAPLYFSDGHTTQTFALYKKLKGPLDSPLKGLTYPRTLTLSASPTPDATTQSARTTKLPLLPE
jgi:hypothetical protein